MRTFRVTRSAQASDNGKTSLYYLFTVSHLQGCYLHDASALSSISNRQRQRLMGSIGLSVINDVRNETKRLLVLRPPSPPPPPRRTPLSPQGQAGREGGGREGESPCCVVQRRRRPLRLEEWNNILRFIWYKITENRGR